jgi:RHS repeat-associated protein
VSYLRHDQTGSTRLITGSAGTVTGKCTYSAYGTSTCEGTSTSPLDYDGQYTSSDSGPIHMRARVYDPSTAQFLSVDPAVPLTRAPFDYAGDNPVNKLDRTGLQEETELCFVPGSCIPAPGGTGASGQGRREWAEKEWRSEERGWEGIEEKPATSWTKSRAA